MPPPLAVALCRSGCRVLLSIASEDNTQGNTDNTLDNTDNAVDNTKDKVAHNTCSLLTLPRHFCSLGGDVRQCRDIAWSCSFDANATSIKLDSSPSPLTVPTLAGAQLGSNKRDVNICAGSVPNHNNYLSSRSKIVKLTPPFMPSNLHGIKLNPSHFLIEEELKSLALFSKRF